MKKNTSEYLNTLSVLKTKEADENVKFNIISAIGLIVLTIGGFTTIYVTIIETYLLFIISLPLCILGIIYIHIIADKVKDKDITIKIKKLKEKYNNEENFSDIIADL